METRSVIAGIVLALVGTTCTPSTEPATTTQPPAFGTEVIDQAVGLWVNAIGLRRPDPVVWQARLTEMCTEGVWERDVAIHLAAKYVGEDEAAFSVRSPGTGPIDMKDAANIVWSIGIQACRENYPEGYMDIGPPFGDSEPAAATELPVEPLAVCPPIRSGAWIPFDMDVLNSYGADRPDTWGGWWVQGSDGAGPVVVWVTDDPANHEAVQDIVGDLDVEFRMAKSTLVELEAAADRFASSQIPGFLDVGVDPLINRVVIEVVADSPDVQAVLTDLDRDTFCLSPYTGPVTAWGVQEQSGEGWRLLGESLGGRTYTVAVASDPRSFNTMWRSNLFTGELPPVDFETEVVAYIGGVVSTGCPWIFFEGFVIDQVAAVVYPLISRPDTGGCLRDARSHGYAVAVRREALPDQFLFQYGKEPKDERDIWVDLTN